MVKFILADMMSSVLRNVRQIKKNALNCLSEEESSFFIYWLSLPLITKSPFSNQQRVKNCTTQAS